MAQSKSQLRPNQECCVALAQRIPPGWQDDVPYGVRSWMPMTLCERHVNDSEPYYFA